MNPTQHIRPPSGLSTGGRGTDPRSTASDTKQTVGRIPGLGHSLDIRESRNRGRDQADSDAGDLQNVSGA